MKFWVIECAAGRCHVKTDVMDVLCLILAISHSAIILFHCKYVFPCSLFRNIYFIRWFILLYKISILAILYMHEILLILRFKYKYNINIYCYTWIKVSIFIIEMNTKNSIQLRWIDKFYKCTCQMSRELTASFLMVSGGSENNETRFRERLW